MQSYLLFAAFPFKGYQTSLLRVRTDPVAGNWYWAEDAGDHGWRGPDKAHEVTGPLLAAPTMRIPGSAAATLNAYLPMRPALVAVLRHNAAGGRPIRRVAIPGLCTGVGGTRAAEAAEQMRVAYDHAGTVIQPWVPSFLHMKFERLHTLQCGHGLPAVNLRRRNYGWLPVLRR